MADKERAGRSGNEAVDGHFFGIANIEEFVKFRNDKYFQQGGADVAELERASAFFHTLAESDESPQGHAGEVFDAGEAQHHPDRGIVFHDGEEGLGNGGDGGFVEDLLVQQLHEGKPIVVSDLNFRGTISFHVLSSHIVYPKVRNELAVGVIQRQRWLL